VKFEWLIGVWVQGGSVEEELKVTSRSCNLGVLYLCHARSKCNKTCFESCTFLSTFCGLSFINIEYVWVQGGSEEEELKVTLGSLNFHIVYLCHARPKCYETSFENCEILFNFCDSNFIDIERELSDLLVFEYKEVQWKGSGK